MCPVQSGLILLSQVSYRKRTGQTHYHQKGRKGLTKVLKSQKSVTRSDPANPIRRSQLKAGLLTKRNLFFCKMFSSSPVH